ncbi:winged helix-turn-helix transcriptional regulator [Allosalinactinospora lopnorensis]|uniref:winged helix-turn-helix transcriptional regulator n=1 Tax=Allosalinactinospora lopnorensis TaxID=1352348 RepID=UPI000623DFAD|nr:winged helix-turn-helix transcriptional regulator [Allosalinactinospora lopnorensis]
MPRRSYDQFCAVARALDAVGERWTLLIVRELLAGPRRYTDLHADLPGVSTDVLAARLKEMEGDGLVERRRLPRPATGSVYELTRHGRGLLPVLSALAEWAGDSLEERRPNDAFRAHWFAIPLMAVLGRCAGTVAGIVEVRINDGTFRLRLDPSGGPAHTDDPAEVPSAKVSMDAATASSLVSGRISPAEAVKDGAMEVRGDSRLAEALRTAQVPAETDSARC